MTWVAFEERIPSDGIYKDGNELITTFKGISGGQCFESWNNWKKENLHIENVCGGGKITHWWEGENSMDKAEEGWFEKENHKKRKKEVEKPS